MLDRINDALARALAARGLDWRSCYARAYPEPPDGRRIAVECSDGGVLGEVAAELGDNAGVHLLVLPDAAAGLPERYIAAASVADVRKEPAHAAELITQVIGGFAVVPLKFGGDWVLCRMDDGYIGWIRSWSLKSMSVSDLELFERRAASRVRENVIQILADPRPDGRPVCDAVSGTRLIARPCERRGWRAVTLADGRSGFVRAGSLEPAGVRRGAVREKLRQTALRFLGIPYLWGGTTAKGFDCSGLTQHVFRLNGMLIPRDSDQQSRYGIEKPVDNVSALDTGDLLFFGKTAAHITHVALYLADGFFLHSHGHVRINALDFDDPLYDEKLVGEWRATKDVLSP